MFEQEVNTQPFEIPQVVPVPNDAVTKLANTKAFSTAKVMATISAIVFAPIMAIVGTLVLYLLGMLLANLSNVDLYTLTVVLVVICMTARILIDMVMPAIGLSRVANSSKHGLNERQASLKFLSRTATTVAALQWLTFVLLVGLLIHKYYERLLKTWRTDPVDYSDGMIVLLLCLVHTVGLQMVAVGAKHYSKGTANKQNSTWCAVGLLVSGLFEIGNVDFILCWLISSGDLNYIFSLEVLAIPFFVLSAFLVHGSYLVILGILLITKSRKKDLFELSISTEE